MNKIVVLSILTFIMCTNYSFSQKADSTSSQIRDSLNTAKTDSIIPKADTTKPQTINSPKKNFYVKASATLTNKGISYIPNLSLGKPAVLFDLSMGNKKLSFEPQLRFSLNGEPWAFLFPVRYKLRSTGKFQMTAGVSPLLNFKSVTYLVKGVSTTELVNRRYLGGEFKPNFHITEGISIGALYLYFCGVSDRAVKNTHFVSLNVNFSNIKLGTKCFARFNPQLYYLYQDGKDGVYFNSTITLLKRNFPFSIQTIMNVAIDTRIPGSQQYIWNASLIYTFNRTYTRK